MREISPDFDKLTSLGFRGVYVTSCSGDSEYDFFLSFVPGEEIDEDPVTGSAHCSLGPYWGKWLGKSKLTAFQASQRGWCD